MSKLDTFAVLLFATALSGLAVPAVAQTHLGVPTGDLVTLRSLCPDAQSGVEPYRPVLPDGSIGAIYIVPEGKQLVLTDVEWLARDIGIDQPASQSTQFLIVLLPANGDITSFPIVYRSYSLHDSDGFATGRDHLTAGVVVDAGFTFAADDPSVDHVIASFGTPPPDFCFINIRGYLVDAEQKQKK